VDEDEELIGATVDGFSQDKMSADKKAGERIHVEMAALALEWDLREVVPRERPDFALHMSDGAIVGLEVVRAINKSEAEDQVAIERFRNRLGERIGRASLPPCGVVAGISPGCGSFLDRSFGTVQWKSLMDLVKSALADHNGPVTVFEEEALKTAGIQDLYRLVVSKVPPAEKAYVWTTSSFMRGPAFILNRIQEKAALLDAYRAEFDADAFWLLVVTGSHPAGWLPSGATEGGVFPKSFDRLFMLDADRGEAQELATFASRLSHR
jgi:hypothetical protein